MALTARFERALTFAAQLHVDQVRKGTDIPYMAHLLGVASLVLEYGGGEDEAIAALLHDAVEDQGGPATRARIQALFRRTVADIVDGCTDTDETPKPPWRARKEAYLAHLPTAAPAVLLVSAADKLYNATSILRASREVGADVWSRFSAGRGEQLWYYRALVTAFRTAGAPAPLVDELDLVMTELEAQGRATT